MTKEVNPDPIEKEGRLILMTKIGQSVVIGSEITVEVVGIERDRVKLSFQGPKEIKVVRKELLDQNK